MSSSSDWVPVRCGACGKVVAAAPHGKGPVIVVCAGCSPAFIADASEPTERLDPDLAREVHLPVPKERRHA